MKTKTVKRYEKLRDKIRDLIKSINNRWHNSELNNSDSYNKKYTKVKFNSGDDISTKKTLELYNMIIIVRSVFHEGIFLRSMFV